MLQNQKHHECVFLMKKTPSYLGMKGTHYDVLLYDVWVFAHRFNKENLHLRRGESESSSDADNNVKRGGDAALYLETVLLCKLDDGFSPFPGGVGRIKNRNLSSFICEILPNVVQCGRRALSVKRRETSRETLAETVPFNWCASLYRRIFSPSSLSGLKNSKDL